jgi:hypothetical protein
MIKDILFKTILLALVALILYGFFPAMKLAIILSLFAGLRLGSLLSEALRRPVSEEQWETMLGSLTRRYEQVTPEELARRAAVLKLGSQASAREVAQTQVNQARSRYSPPRSKRELGAEVLGLIAFVLLLPLDVGLYTHDVFSLRGGLGWAGFLVAGLGVGLYAWPHRRWKSPDQEDMRIWWWALPFIPAFLLLTHAVATRHPYLNPFNPDRPRLAAERVLSLKNIVTAGQYADWVLRYAQKLDAQGEQQSAIHYYREALRLDAGNRLVGARLAVLEQQVAGGLGERTVEHTGSPTASPMKPYWTPDHPVIPSPRRRVDAQLDRVAGCTVVIIPVGPVPAELLDAVGYAIHQELDLPVCISPDPVAVPPHTRVRGLVTGSQWEPGALVRAFTNATGFFPAAPIKYLLITPVDLYVEGANYVFSVSYPWGALVSSARFDGPKGDDTRLRARTAKQALGAVLKSFNVPASADREDVTSYVRSVEEFDTKGNRPDAATLQLFRQAVADLNARWQAHQARTPP